MVVLAASASAVCPNRCSMKGRCNAYNECECNKGYKGYDCSMGICPMGKAWSDEATSSDFAHNPVECSNMGLCTQTTGNGAQCVCRAGYSGAACERMDCEKGCNAKGKCIPMQELAKVRHNQDYSTFRYILDSGIDNSYKTTKGSWIGVQMLDGVEHAYTTDEQGVGGLAAHAPLFQWDYDMIHGCLCDEGYMGFDCSLRSCPKGDDPISTGQADELQIVQCTSRNGTLTLSFKGATTVPISVDATAPAIAAALVALPTVRGINVVFAVPADVFCSTDVKQAAKITFTHDPGPQPALVPILTDLIGGEVKVGWVPDNDGVTSEVKAKVAGIKPKRGTKEFRDCAGRGLCDETTGVCSCFKYYGIDVDGTCNTETGVTLSCPGEIACSGHGVCQSPKTCVCSAGWASGDCSIRKCPEGPSWFDYPDSAQSAHDFAHPVECSNQGLCDRSKGECLCKQGFHGGACEHMTCPGDPICSAHGQCLTMSQLALAATLNGDATDYTYGRQYAGGSTLFNYNVHNVKTWDYQMMRGCKCDEGFEGYDCSLRTCPSGDDPETYGQQNEVQLISCVGTGGTWRLGFRQGVTVELAWNVTAAAMVNALQAVDTVGFVSVTFYNETLNAGACNYEGSNVIAVEFLERTGDLPTLLTFNDKLENNKLVSWITTPLGSGTIFTVADGADFSTSPILAGLGGVPDLMSTYTWNYNTTVMTYWNDTFRHLHDGITRKTNRSGLGYDVMSYTNHTPAISRRGTREYAICSNRGVCDYTTGSCMCTPGYGQSDGNGNRGIKDDCGFRIEHQVLLEEE